MKIVINIMKPYLSKQKNASPYLHHTEIETKIKWIISNSRTHTGTFTHTHTNKNEHAIARDSLFFK